MRSHIIEQYATTISIEGNNQLIAKGDLWDRNLGIEFGCYNT